MEGISVNILLGLVNDGKITMDDEIIFYAYESGAYFGAGMHQEHLYNARTIRIGNDGYLMVRDDSRWTNIKETKE